jgi:hypothetical protein
MNNIEQYRKRFNMLIESSMGDVKPLINEQTTNDLIGKTVNLYKDLEMKRVWRTFKIESVKKNANGAFLSLAIENEKMDYDFFCKNPNRIGYYDSSIGYNYYYNKQLTDSLNSQFCQTGQGGENVPKADMASNNSANSGQAPQSA